MDLATDDGGALQERVARVERQARWLTAIATALAMLCVTLLFWQIGRPAPAVEARGFVLRDARWRSRAELMTRADGSPILRLMNPNGRSRATLQLRDDGMVALRMMDTDGVVRAELRLEEGGAPSLTLAGDDGQARVFHATDPDDQAARSR